MCVCVCGLLSSVTLLLTTPDLFCLSLPFPRNARAQYEKIHSGWLRQKALDMCIDHIKQEDLNTRHIDIGPVNKAINMLSGPPPRVCACVCVRCDVYGVELLDQAVAGQSRCWTVDRRSWGRFVFGNACVTPLCNQFPAVFFAEGKSEHFMKHVERVDDYLWLASDGLKMQVRVRWRVVPSGLRT